MKILNINSNYFNSGLYKLMDEHFIEQNIQTYTYVPIHKSSNIREECRFVLPNHVEKSICLRKYDRIIFSYKHYKIKKDILKKYNFNNIDIVYAHTLFSNGCIALEIYKKFNIPYNVMVCGTDINLFFKYMFHLRKLGIDILKNAKKIYFSSEASKEYLLNKFVSNEIQYSIREKCIVIPFGIDNMWFDKIGKAKEIDTKKEINILTVASIENNKNQIAIAKACEKLINRGYKIKYTIVGNIQSENVYKKLIKYEFIKYIQRLDHNELLEIYRNNDIFAMASLKESFGLVYAEAMSQGLPIIYTANQGFDRHFNEGEVGYSVKPKDIDDIAHKIELLINNYSDISINCIKLVNRFRWKNISNRYYHHFIDSTNIKRYGEDLYV